MSLSVVISAIAMGLVGLFFYTVIRYGKVVRTWIRIDKDQIRILKEANKRYRSTHPPSRPSGRPLYKKKMISHEGVAIYQNGIYAKFAVGKNGKYRFVPFHEISDIYPARVEFLSLNSLMTLTDPTAINGIQIETESSMVFLVNSKYHDLKKILPALKQAMGAWWGSKYHDDELVRGGITGGDLYIHKTLRRMTSAKPSERRPIETPLKPITSGKGSLLLEERPEDVKTRGRTFFKGGASLFLTGVVMTIIGIVILYVGLWIPPVWFMLILCLILGPAIVFAGVFLFLVSRKLKPVRIFENGIEAYAPIGTRSFFISYGAMTEVTETKNIIDGDIYLFKTANPMLSVAIRKGLLGLEEHFESIKAKIGRPEYLIRLEPSEVKEVTSRKVEYGLYATSTIASVIVSFVICMVIFQGDDLAVFMSGFGWIMPMMTMVIVVAITFSMKQSMGGFIPKKLNIKIPAAIVVVMLIFALVSSAFGSNLFGPSPEVRHISPKPVSSAIAPGLYENTTVHAYGDILVDFDQITEFKNTTITFHPTMDGEFGIWVAEGGKLILENSTVVSSSSTNAYKFEIMGSASIKDSTISGLWGEWDDYDGGLEIYSDNVTIDGAIIGGARQSSIIVVDSNPLIANSTIYGAGDDGIELQNSKARIFNNTISNCEWGMYIYAESQPTIENNLISQNHFGILIEHSSPTIINNRFEYNQHDAILYRKSSSPILVDNTFISNGANVVREGDIDTSSMCLVLIVGTAIVCLLVLFRIHRQQHKEEDEHGQFDWQVDDKTLWRPPKGPSQ